MTDLELLKGQIVPVVRAPSRASVLPLAEALAAGGLGAIEITTTTPDCLGAIEDVASRWGRELMVGIGTVLEPEMAGRAADAGARFVVSPIFDPAIVAATQAAGLLSIPGAYTPSEIWAAWQARADVVKVFPATALGPGYLRDLRAPMPELRLMPTGGVDLENVADWFAAGAYAVGAGSALVPKAMLEAGDWNGLRQLAERWRAASYT